jgi:penicillin amidase
VLIARETSGTPRIRAQTLLDGYYGLGFMHATDRLFQVFATRALGKGRLAEAFGDIPKLIDSDRRSRALRLDRVSEDDLAGLGEHAMAVVRAYCAGVNDVIDRGHRPFELRLTGNRVEPFTPADIICCLRTIAYVGLDDAQGDMELAIARALAADPGTLRAWSQLFGRSAEGYRQEDYRRLVVDGHRVDGHRAAGADTARPDGARVASPPSPGGSNAWAVAGRLTASGTPLLCNDPHLDITSLPAVWYEAVLETPGLWIMGATVAGGPVFASGWNRNLAWGVTYAHADSEDLFVEECRDGRFLRAGRWHPFPVRQEEIRTRSGRSVLAAVYESENGWLDGNPHTAGRYLTRRWAGEFPLAGSSMAGLVALNAARDLDEGLAAIGSIRLPGLHWVLADRSGRVGRGMNAAVPERRGRLSGLLPMPAWRDGVGWDGLRDAGRFPVERDPASGIVVLANQRFGGDASSQTMTASADRADRIRQMLLAGHRQSGGPLTERDMMRIQADVYSLRAERILRFLRDRLRLHPLGRRLLSWDCCMEAHSREATSFSQFCHGLLLTACKDVLFPSRTLAAAAAGPFFTFNFRLIEEAWIAARPPFAAVDWDAIVPAVLDWVGAEQPPWGEDPIVVNHVLLGDTPVGRLLRAGPYLARGDASTVQQGNRFGRRAKASGPSYRLIVDFADEIAFTALPGGASGRPSSQYYRRGVDDWAAGRYRLVGPKD